MADHKPDVDETETLISSQKVENTHVFDVDGKPLGRIYSFMINKKSGYVQYAVLTFGGFLGLGKDHYPIPWKRLEYNIEYQGYVAHIDPKKLTGAPHHVADCEPVYSPAYDVLVNQYYGIV